MPSKSTNLGRLAKPSHMTKTEFRLHLVALQMQDVPAETLLDVCDTTIRRMKSGRIPIDARTTLVLRAMAKFNISAKKMLGLLDK